MINRLTYHSGTNERVDNPPKYVLLEHHAAMSAETNRLFSWPTILAPTRRPAPRALLPPAGGLNPRVGAAPTRPRQTIGLTPTPASTPLPSQSGGKRARSPATDADAQSYQRVVAQRHTPRTLPASTTQQHPIDLDA